ncbi:MAG TPA: MFS transporter [Chloroflexota bacterium]|nr:MFS transporter [Chloroflexota bacterium]
MSLNMTGTTKALGHDLGGSAQKGDRKDPATTGSTTERLLTSDFIFTTTANFANAFGIQMLVATMPIYVLSLGGSQTDIGLISGAVALTALLFRPFVGWVTDAWRRRPLVLVGTACYSLASVVYILAGSIPGLLLGRILHGFGLSCSTTASNAYIADIAPRKRRAEAMGIFAAMHDLGLITGPAIGFFLVGLIGFQRLFCMTATLALTAFVISFFARERRESWAIVRQPWSPRTGIVAIDALPVAWTALCMGLGFGPLNAFISVFAQSRGVENPGLYFTVQATALLVSRTFAGRLADRRGRAFVIVPGVILMATALALLPMAFDFPHFMISASLFGLGFGSAQPATMALLIDKVRPEQRGLAASTYFTGFDAGISTGSLVLGIVSQSWGFGVMWSLSAACTLLGLTGILGNRRRPR